MFYSITPWFIVYSLFQLPSMFFSSSVIQPAPPVIQSSLTISFSSCITQCSLVLLFLVLLWLHLSPSLPIVTLCHFLPPFVNHLILHKFYYTYIYIYLYIYIYINITTRLFIHTVTKLLTTYSLIHSYIILISDII